MLLGALFRAVGTPDVPLLAMPEPKRRYLARDLDRWARYLGVEFRFSSRFPLRTVLPLRVTLLAGDRTEALVARLFRAAWVEDRDVGDEAVVRAALAEVGLDPALVERAGEPATKQALHDSTAAAIAGGVFGAPTSVVTAARVEIAPWSSGGRIASSWSTRRCAAGSRRSDDRRGDRHRGLRRRGGPLGRGRAPR
jgi:2-hydroxychromene-2-carboxylate isomerase